MNHLFQWIEEVFVKYFDDDKVIVLFELDIYFIYLVIPFWYKAAEENVIADSGNTLVSLIFNLFVTFTVASSVKKSPLKRVLQLRFSEEL